MNRLPWPSTMRVLAGALTLTALAAAAPAAHGQAAAPDCAGPARTAVPGTPAWHLREAENAYCATQRNLDTAANPAYHAAAAAEQAIRPLTAIDPLREPTLLAGSRFRFDETTITGADGKALPTFLFRPCDRSCASLAPGLDRHEPPYPAVVVMHGGAANHEMYLWASEALAEAGYMVVSVNLDSRTDNGHRAATINALEWLLSTPSQPFADGSHNPHWAQLDRGKIGLAGHSAGGVAVSRLGQEDPRVSAVVSWDRAQSTVLPSDIPLRTPSLFVTADYNCQQVPVCLPQPYTAAPDPLGPGNKDQDFQRLRAAGVDSMKVALRAAVHLDFTEWPVLNASRYGAVTTAYFTRAWFDRYLKSDPAGTRRLTATRFDDSADVHNISSGRWNPLTQANVPARIAGQPAVDRLSFHFRSGYWLDGGALACENIRSGCPTTAGLLRSVRPAS